MIKIFANLQHFSFTANSITDFFDTGGLCGHGCRPQIFCPVSCTIKHIAVNLRYKSSRERRTGLTAGPTRQAPYHIKVDWETLQIILKHRVRSRRPMAGPAQPQRQSPRASVARGLQRTAGTQILFIRSFIASFDVVFSPYRGRASPRPHFLYKPRRQFIRIFYTGHGDSLYSQ